MINRLLIFIAFITLFNLTAYGQFEIKTNALGLVANNYNGQVELLLNDKSGIELEASYRETPWILSLSGSEIENSSFRTMISYKYYIGGEDPTSGLYFGPYLKLKVAGLDNIPTEVDKDYVPGPAAPETVRVFNTAFFIGLNAGQKIVFNNNLLIEYYGGFGYALYNDKRINDKDYEPALENFIAVERNSFTWPLDFRLGLTLGYRFWR
ncbi:DUF3575 domain-containing protein [Portibacter lacus]|uniref:DUF3575 domain-containing protein n=1 Tax=Portibacter lacus TaxID=1099794 RepID=A0AA37SLU3_9BACT|nr:DUF3575 domain-containing protein [Portibacter lacus]GLR16868.1 hypothetical protein GCM10007940_14830 [Portibacter lacus]